jgi:hypothetical protein
LDVNDCNLACEVFKLSHPCKTGVVLNCAGVYTEQQFKETSMYKNGCWGKFCQERLVHRRVLPSDGFDGVWHDAKSDPPTEDGEYLTKKLITGRVGDKEYSKWYYQQLHYTTDYGWNTYRFGELNDKDQEQYAMVVDYWTSELI